MYTIADYYDPSPENSARVECLKQLLAETKPACTGVALPIMYPSSSQTSEKDDLFAYHAEMVSKFEVKKEEHRRLSAEKKAAQEKVIELLTAKARRMAKENAKLTELVNLAVGELGKLV